MKTGRTIQEVLQDVMRQSAAKKDIKAPTSALTMHDGKFIDVRGQGDFEVTEHTHNQIGDRIGIPSKYYDRMRTEAPQLLDRNVNHWFSQKPEVRMVRTMTVERPTMRAFLSDRYRVLDNDALAIKVLPELVDQQLQVISCELTERRLYIKFTTPRVQGEVNRGDVVQAGGIISNSEIGSGAVSVMPFITRLVCTNGMTMEEMGKRSYHTGKRIGSGEEEEASVLYSDETVRQSDEAFWMQTRDLVRGVVRQDRFDILLQRMRQATQQQIEGDIPAAVEVLSTRFQLAEGEKAAVLNHLVQDGAGMTAWGLANAITSVAGEAETYDRASELERLGGQLLALQPADWKPIATAKGTAKVR